MIRFGTVGVTIATFLLGASAAIVLAPGDPAPPVTGDTISGESFGHDYGSSRATLVNFWASWCVPCRDEMPKLQELSARYRRAGLIVVGVTVDRKVTDAVKRFVADTGAKYPILANGQRFAEEWGGVGVFPTTFLVGSDGKILRKYLGATPDQIRTLVTDVEAVLAGRPLGSAPLPPSTPEPSRP